MYYFISFNFSLPDHERAVLLNADRFLLVSGQRNYFYQQKEYYLEEINRIGNILDKVKYKKKHYKKKWTEDCAEKDLEISRLEKDIIFFREKVKIFIFSYN